MSRYVTFKRALILDNFLAATSFPESQNSLSSLYQCVSFGLVEIIIRFVNFDFTLLQKLDSDLKLAIRKEENLINIRSIVDFQKLLDLLKTSPNPKKGFSLLEENIRQEEIYKSFEVATKSILLLITENNNELHNQMETFQIFECYTTILETIANHYNVCIRLKRGSTEQVFEPRGSEFYPVLYLYYENHKFMILYTREALLIDSSSGESDLVMHSNLLCFKDNVNLIPEVENKQRRDPLVLSGHQNNDMKSMRRPPEVLGNETNFRSDLEPSPDFGLSKLNINSPVSDPLNESSFRPTVGKDDFNVEIHKGSFEGKDVIVKRYTAKYGRKWDPQIFNNEIRILNQCTEYSNQGLPFLKCYNVELKQKSLAILLEPFEKDLDDKILDLLESRNQFTEIELKIIVTKLIRGFSMLQQIGIEHRDIKPGNILISGSGENIDVRIIDFSISELKLMGMDSSNHRAKVFTTELYRAPEIRNIKEGVVDYVKADCFSLGIVFYQISNVNIDITKINSDIQQGQLLKNIGQVKYSWLKNLLANMLNNVENRLTFIRLTKYLPGMVTECS